MPERTLTQWLTFLEARLDVQARRAGVYRDYYDGRHPTSFTTAKFQRVFGNLFSGFADNWLQIVVDAAVERLGVMGFRFGADVADARAWEFWQASGMDAEIVKAFTESVKCGESYLLVESLAGRLPRITVEHSSQMTVAYDESDRSTRLAALKRWAGDDGHWYATLWLPEMIVRYRSLKAMRAATAFTSVEWVARPERPAERNALGVVPVVALANNPDMLLGGTSDMQPGIPLNRAINKLCSDLMVGSEFTSFPQRWATGLEVPRLSDGQPDGQAMLKAAMGTVWSSANPDAKFGSLPVGDVKQHVAPIEMFVQHMAAQTRTPPHYLLSQIVNVSGEALQGAETGLVSRVRRKQVGFADALEEVVRLCFALDGDAEKAAQLDAETIWRDPESRSPGVIADSLVKKAQIGVPLEVLWEEAGYSPVQIARMRRLKGLPVRTVGSEGIDDLADVLGSTSP